MEQLGSDSGESFMESKRTTGLLKEFLTKQRRNEATGLTNDAVKASTSLSTGLTTTCLKTGFSYQMLPQPKFRVQSRSSMS